MPGPHDKILILGGTAEAVRLAAQLVAEGKADVLTSLAGRTEEPEPPAGRLRRGGFGGAEGLLAFLRSEGITGVYDATHPFARQISANAEIACAAAGIPLVRLEREPWQKQAGDNWWEMGSLQEAARALPARACAFLALGRQHIAAFADRRDCRFLLRMVDPPAHPPPFADHALVLGKPSADPAQEMALMREHGVTHLVCRNSGGEAGYGKVVAARHLAIPVLMIGR
ncbi:cobalt-precorrin-6A reductase [Rhizobium paknamense]|uniref:Precorrin-6A/cobalt-precorrin-6A reductase n=1 Tax=Rhizobium paknamense TaxID=1206817 RepID=A0ABU0I6D5_9HYPH|nr:cobalt-precorrin-6A reductase [Rhizobium paknamense]MDQ0453779.1 precorrin-6A/cobalt-precorrin-6A reductase [Rhizobium paknamense]